MGWTPPTSGRASSPRSISRQPADVLPLGGGLAVVRCWFVTGVSGVGKSTALRRASEVAASHFCFRDIDDEGVPSGADVSWRRRQVAAWLERAVDLQRQGRMLVLSSVVEPGDVDYAGPRAPAVRPRFCLLDASEEVLAARLLGRSQAPEAAADLLRVTGQTPDE